MIRGRRDKMRIFLSEGVTALDQAKFAEFIVPKPKYL